MRDTPIYIGAKFMSMYLMNRCLIDVYLAGTHLTGVNLVYLMGIDLMSIYKFCEDVECSFPQMHLAILSLPLFVLMIRHTSRRGRGGRGAEERCCTCMQLS